MEAKCEETVALLHVEVLLPHIMKEVGTSEHSLQGKNSLNEQGHVKHKLGSGRKPSISHPC